MLLPLAGDDVTTSDWRRCYYLWLEAMLSSLTGDDVTTSGCYHPLHPQEENSMLLEQKQSLQQTIATLLYSMKSLMLQRAKCSAHS